jgi:hypothetical protein
MAHSLSVNRSSSRSPRRFTWKWIGIGALLGLAGWFTVTQAPIIRSARELDGIYARAVALEFPTSANEISRVVHVGPGTDPLTEEFVKVMQQRAQITAVTAATSTEYPVDMLVSSKEPIKEFPVEVSQELAISSPYIEKASNLALRAGDTFGTHDWDMEVVWSEMKLHKQLIRLLAARAIKSAADHDVQRAVLHLRRAGFVASTLRHHPSSFGFLVFVGELQMLHSCAAKCMELSPEGAQDFADAVKVWKPFDLRYAVRGEAYSKLAMLRNRDKLIDDRPHSEQSWIREGQPIDIRSRALAAEFLKLWMPVLEFLNLNAAPRPLEFRQTLELYNVKALELVDTSSDPLAAVLIPSYSGLIYCADRCLTQSYCVQALATAVNYYRANKRAPTSLREIGFAENDPATGLPIKMDVTEDEIRIYNYIEEKNEKLGQNEVNIADSSSPDHGSKNAVVFYVRK